MMSKKVSHKLDYQSRAQRIAAFPCNQLPLEAKATVYWNDQLIPFIDAHSDNDAATCLGLVHAHLRLGQLELMKRIAYGRLSEMAGPFAIEMDRVLRKLCLGEANETIERQLPESTKEWLTCFCKGLNHYIQVMEKEPQEFDSFDFKRELWTVTDLLQLARLIATDVNWGVIFSFLRLNDEAGFEDFWTRYVHYHSNSKPSFAAGSRLAGLQQLLIGLSRSGSNSVVISPKRSATGSALIANDPHLGIMIPNFWVLGGWRSPSYHVTGMMIPGLPFVALGRNLDCAWGGTNMRSWSSDLVDISHLTDDHLEVRKERIKVRFWPDRNSVVRMSPYGPVLSDSPMFGSKSKKVKIALRWMGHFPSDEITCFLKMNRATNWKDFSEAFSNYSVSGQTFLYADKEGNIGMMPAVQLPKRETPTAERMVLDTGTADCAWNSFWSPTDFPTLTNPDEGYIVSANNCPVDGKLPFSSFFSPDDRFERLRRLVESNDAWDVEALKKLQQDSFSMSSVKARDQFVECMPESAQREFSVWFRAMRDWDGHYRKEATGPVAFQLLLYFFVQEAYKEQYSRKIRHALLASPFVMKFVVEELKDLTEAKKKILFAAAARAAKDFSKFKSWGEMHRLRIAHPMRLMPVGGKRFVFMNYPVDGANETVVKTAHHVSKRKHFTRYGAQARQISDLSDIDENYFVLLGGQDGWLMSENLLDQVEIWRRGDLVRVPLRIETIENTFADKLTLSPR